MPLQLFMQKKKRTKTTNILYGTIKWQNVWHDDKSLFNETI
jgi:hypothetical protein